MSSIARTAATGGDLDPDFLRWSTSLPVDRRLLEVDCRGSVAHVRGLEAAGLLTADEGRRLREALESLPGKVASGEVVLREDEEDVHMAVEAWLMWRSTVTLNRAMGTWDLRTVEVKVRRVSECSTAKDPTTVRPRSMGNSTD